MPYRSTVWSQMSAQQLVDYRSAFSRHIGAVIRAFQPDLIHSHHVWIVSSLLKDVAPEIPVVTSCHATGLRQMRLVPHLAAGVQAGCRRNERFVVLHSQHRDELQATLRLGPDRVRVIGAGYRDEVFFGGPAHASRAGHVAYAGKYAAAKGLPELLDVMDRLPHVTLHVAGSGASTEADSLRVRMEGMPNVVLHGMLDQPRLAELLQSCQAFILPSYYEGLPLVLVEALACGNRLVCTRLGGVEEQLAPTLGELLEFVDLPTLIGPDTPAPAEVPAFVDRLERALTNTLARPQLTEPPAGVLAAFTWSAVFDRVEREWRSVLESVPQH